MIPHIDTQVLGSNPQFARLHKDLRINKLDSDGSTKLLDVKEARQEEASANVS